jgi:Icc-related predicted phosphoesterase
MIRVAAVGDLHFGPDATGKLRPQLERLPEEADLFLMAGDLTRVGKPDEARVLAKEIADVAIPTVAVLGNHDYHSNDEDEVRRVLEDADVKVLEGEGLVVEVGGTRVGIAGTKGFGGGFAGACGSEFGEPEMKAFIAHTRVISDRLAEVLDEMEADLRIALLHYSPIKGTLQGERPEIYPFLGSYLLAEAIDRSGANLVVHGHAHHGTEKGVTPGGIHVRNVALPLIKHPYNLYCLRNGDVAA